MTSLSNENLISQIHRSKYLVTSYSSVAYEAKYYGCKVLIIGKEGCIRFKEEVAQGYFEYIEKYSNLHSAIKANTQQKKIDSFLIQSNIEIIKNQIAKL